MIMELQSYSILCIFPKEEVLESVEEVKSLYKQALDKKEELYDTRTVIQRIPDSKIWDFCSKTSHEWWQVAMDKWNTLSDEEQKKYNQFIGFNDFSDYLMNIMAGALMRLRDTGKLDYEEGSLLLEKQKQKQEQPKVSIWKHWKCGLAGNGEGKQIYLIKDGDAYSLSSCLGFECDYIELSELDNLMFEKQGEQKSKDKYTFNSIPRLLDMIEPTDRAKRYCQKLIDSLQQEGYVTDAKIISEHLKLMNGEEVSMATMDKNQDEKKSVEWSEEDKGFVDLLLAIFTNEHPNGLFTTGDITVFNGKSVSSNRIITWLKSLKHQNTWKPTEEQLSCFKQAIGYFGDELQNELQSLYEDLLKL